MVFLMSKDALEVTQKVFVEKLDKQELCLVNPYRADFPCMIDSKNAGYHVGL